MANVPLDVAIEPVIEPVNLVPNLLNRTAKPRQFLHVPVMLFRVPPIEA